ncbi:helix-turn-helix transcriptional regulator [Chitinophaga sp. 212800010-3]|uniref:helix-turn-helix transcriptional regulator n=1 Tax=unclassified Chitinophaga TaxID=2619133 RepID=UPI002E0EC90C
MPEGRPQPFDATTPGNCLPAKYKLSPRELDIIRLIKEGKSTKQIAVVLELSIYTVETHHKNINRKLNVQSTAELISVVNNLRS